MVKWQIASSLDRDYIFELAGNSGWFDDPPRVQVKCIRGMVGDLWFVLEPYEENCNCPDLIQPPKIYIRG